jgi:hypothetical protein
VVAIVRTVDASGAKMAKTSRPFTLKAPKKKKRRH